MSFKVNKWPDLDSAWPITHNDRPTDFLTKSVNFEILVFEAGVVPFCVVVKTVS